MQSGAKIFGIIFLAASLAVLITLTFSLDDEKTDSLELIELIGNIHLPKEQYLKYAKLVSRSEYRHLGIDVVKDRLRKHPYVESVDVLQSGNEIRIELREKNFKAILFANERQYLISEENRVIPVLPFTKQIDYPVIINPEKQKAIKNFKSALENKDLVVGMKILTTIKLLDPSLYSRLSEVDLREGKDIILYIANSDYPLIIGRGNEIRKLCYLNKVWRNIEEGQISEFLDYVDLRYRDHIFLGLSESSIDKENQS